MKNFLWIMMLGGIGYLQGCQLEGRAFWYKELIHKKYEQIGRIGFPFLTEILADEEVNDLLLAGDPQTDVEKVRDAFVARVAALRTNLELVPRFPEPSSEALTSGKVADTFLPNVITLDFSKDVSFSTFNGLRHGDDAADIMIETIVGRSGFNDLVEERPDFLNSFPYLNGRN